ncbi:MAG: hypothetical protein AB1714_17315 [Acidobacteriota bacterium]
MEEQEPLDVLPRMPDAVGERARFRRADIVASTDDEMRCYRDEWSRRVVKEGVGSICLVILSTVLSGMLAGIIGDGGIAYTMSIGAAFGTAIGVMATRRARRLLRCPACDHAVGRYNARTCPKCEIVLR